MLRNNTLPFTHTEGALIYYMFIWLIILVGTVVLEVLFRVCTPKYKEKKLEYDRK